MKYLDQHIHCEFSPDSNEPAEYYLEKLRTLGIKNFILTDHYDPNRDGDLTDYYSNFKNRENKLNELRKKYKDIDIESGIEVGYTKENFEKSLQFLDKFDFSLVLLSVHYQGNINYYLTESFDKEKTRDIMKDYLSAQIEAAKIYPHYDVFCHVDYGFRTAFLIDPSIIISEYEDQLIELFKTLIARDKVFELNTKVQERINNDEHVKYLLNLYKKVGGVNLSISSDSHHADRYLSSFEKYKNMAKETGFDHINYFIHKKRYDFKI